MTDANIHPELRNPKTLLLDSQSMDILFSPQVLRALKIIQTHFLNENSIMKLNEFFMPVARKFVSSITEKQLNQIIEEYLLTNGKKISRKKDILIQDCKGLLIYRFICSVPPEDSSSLVNFAP
jgi:hypothetical protein